MINVLKQNGNRYYIDPLTGAVAIGAGGALLGTLGGQYMAGQQANAMSESNRIQALATLAQALNRPPEIPEVKFERYAAPEEYQLAGTLTPETLTQTQLRQILSSPEYLQAQEDVLSQYQLLTGEGLSAIDRAAIAEIQNEIATQERGQREAILQNMAQRGLSGSGAELAANLLAQQQASQTASLEGQRIGAQAQQARLQALGNVAQLGGVLGETEYERALNKARAEDVINQFNVQNRNVAQAQNLAAAQAIQNARTEQRNQIAQANVDLENQQRLQAANRPLAQYGLQSQYASGISGALGGQSALQAQQAMNQYQTQANLLGTGLQAGGTLGAMYYMRQPTQSTRPNLSTAEGVRQQQNQISSDIRNQYGF
jgi:hypothetical protein